MSRQEISYPTMGAMIVAIPRWQWDRLWEFYPATDRITMDPGKADAPATLWCWEAGVWLVPLPEGRP